MANGTLVGSVCAQTEREREKRTEKSHRSEPKRSYMHEQLSTYVCICSAQRGRKERMNIDNRVRIQIRKVWYVTT